MESEWFKALVIILSVMLALFLLLSIIILVRVIQIFRQIKRITDHAEEVVDKAEEVADFFQKASTPVAILKLLANVADSFSKAKDKVKKGKKKR